VTGGGPATSRQFRKKRRNPIVRWSVITLLFCIVSPCPVPSRPNRSCRRLSDYPILHKNTAALFPAAAKLGLKIGICYEDQTISKLVEAGDLAKGDRVKHAREVLAWLKQHWCAWPR
jgi:hypothetical protein